MFTENSNSAYFGKRSKRLNEIKQDKICKILIEPEEKYFFFSGSHNRLFRDLILSSNEAEF